MEDYNKEDQILIASVASAVAKSIFYIGLCITLGMLLSKCSVNSETIIQCEESCGTSGIKEVTSWSCKCGDKETISESPWVLPR